MEGSVAETKTLNVLRGKIASISPNALDTSLSVEGAAAEAKATGEAIKAAEAKAEKHINNTENPHGVTKKQLGLENVDNTADMDKPVSVAQALAIAAAKKPGDDALAALENKVEKEEGKGLSTNDFTDEYKSKVDKMDEGGEVEIPDGSITAAKIAANAVSQNFTATLPADGWISEQTGTCYQEITVGGLLASDKPIVDVDFAGIDVEQTLKINEEWKPLRIAVDSANTLFVRFVSTPTVDIPIHLLVVRK